MNYVLTATNNNIEDLIDSYRGHVNIIALTQEDSYVKYVKQCTEKYTHTENDVERPISSLRWIHEGLLPKLSLVFAKGIGFGRDIDQFGVERLVPLEHEDYIKIYATDVLSNPITKSKLYLFADQIYNGNKPLVFTCTREEEDDLAILETIGRIFNDWFKIYPTTLNELECNRDIISLQPNPAYKKEVAEFMVEYRSMHQDKINLK
ncbi:MAG: hypothetical protein ACRC0G_07545 [Fusobacteriaceae bacterium]